MNSQPSMFEYIAGTAFLLLMWLPVLAYPVLEVLVLAKARGLYRLIGALPLVAMVPIIALTIKAYCDNSNLWPLFLILASPAACVWAWIILAMAVAREKAKLGEKLSSTRKP